MRSSFVLFLSAICIAGAVSTAFGELTTSDLYVYYPFEDTSGTVFADASPNGDGATYYRWPRFSELPSVDVSNVADNGAVGLGVRDVGGVNHEIMIGVPASAALPAAGDDFAVSFWLNSDNFTGSYGLLTSYNLNGLEWSIGMNSGPKGLAIWSGDADASGTAAYGVDCSATGANLTNGQPAHFIIQFNGDNGISNVYVNGASIADSSDTTYWGNEREGFVIGARVLDARPYTVCNYNPVMDDFAILSGVLNSTEVSNLYTSGAAGFGAQRLAHYTMDDTSGSQIIDASANANHGTLVGYASSTMGSAVRDVPSASRPGVFGNSVEFANGFGPEHANLITPGDLPGHGEAFTVCFWAKPDENLAELYGWDQSGVIMDWSNDPTPGTPGGDGLGFSIGQHVASDGAMIVRVTDGSATGSSSMYGVYLGDGGGNGLNLDPTVFHHFAVTVDENGDVTGMYVDGVNIAAHFVNSGWNVNDINTATIGGRFVGGSYSTGYGGYVDDLAVFKGVLTPEQINMIKKNGVAASVPEPSALVLLAGLLTVLVAGRRFGRR
ncbi:MAG: hypothetical protein JW818_10005 [Pirellulales bacterium]|nr:hypothetical protein [Pirellulales bacterium]